MANWTTAFEGTPAGTDQRSEGDDRIREFKVAVREEIETEHDSGFSGTDNDYEDTGRHVPGSARVFLQSASPTGLLKPTNAGAMPPIVLNLDNKGASTLDNGRLWVRLDDMQPFVREQIVTGGARSDLNVNEGDNGAAWSSLWMREWTTTDVATDDDQQAAGANTRETVDGGLGGVLGVSIDCPDDGRSYEISVIATCAYSVSSDRAIGFWLVEDDGAAADVDAKIVHNHNASAMEGEATLIYTQTAPTNGTTYEYTVEFAASAAAATATVNPSAAVIAGGLAGDFVGETSWSRISATIRPRYLVGGDASNDYTVL